MEGVQCYPLFQPRKKSKRVEVPKEGDEGFDCSMPCERNETSSEPFSSKDSGHIKLQLTGRECRPDYERAAPAKASGAFKKLMQAGRTRVSRQNFHVDVSEDGTYISIWLRRAPDNVAWQADMKVKEEGSNSEIILTLSTGTPSASKPSDVISWECNRLLSNMNQGSRPRLSASMLKSAIQKDVRLCRPDSAIRVSLHLLKDSWSEFLRRATIIALEDAILHPDLPFLMWLLAAVAKGYQPSRLHAAVCMRIMHELASVKCRDPLSEADEADLSCPSLSTIPDNLPPEQAMMLRALVLRASFGGMAGDVRMLKCYSRIWLERFSGACSPPPSLSLFTAGPSEPIKEATSQQQLGWADWLKELYNQTPKPSHLLRKGTGESVRPAIDVSAIGAIKLSDIPPSAVDFHCSNIIEDVLKDTAAGQQAEASCRIAGEDVKAIFRSAMWHFRSSVNKKRLLNGEIETQGDDGSRASLIWSQLASEAQRYSLNVVRRKFGLSASRT